MQPHSILDIPDEGTVLEPVVGGSGTLYLSIAAAIAGESAIVGQADRITGVVPQAGTVAGSIVGPGTLSAVDGFYKDYYVVNTDLTPTNGLVSQWARVSNYVGASRTLTLDKPWDFAAESDFVLVKVIRIALLKDVDEDVSSAVGFELDLAGHRLKGKIDCTAQEFHWIRGAGGYVTNGVQKSSFGLLKVDDCTVSRRDATIYALLMTEGSNLGRCELSKCTLAGRVAGRRGFLGWTIDYCENTGVPTNAGVDDLPYTLIESPLAGAAVVVSALDVKITGEFSGAILFSENSVTGTGYINVDASINRTKDSSSAIPDPQGFSLARADAGATLTLTPSAGDILIWTDETFSFLWTTSLTGTASLDLSANGAEIMSSGPQAIGINIRGSSDTTGVITLAGQMVVSTQFRACSLFLILITSRLNGASVTFSAFAVFSGGSSGIIGIGANQNAGAPSVTISGLVVLADSDFQHETFAVFGATAVSVGTWVVSGGLFFDLNGSQLFQIPSGVSGGTFTVSSSTITVIFSNVAVTPDFAYITFDGTGGTCIVSGTSFIYTDHYTATCRIVQATGTGGTATVSGNVSIYNLSCEGQTQVVLAIGAGSTGSVTGVITYFSCEFGNLVTLLSTLNAAATVNGPSAIIFDKCVMDGAITSVAGTGTAVWAGASLTFKECHVDGLFTLTATNFATVQSYHTRFNGNSGNKSVSASGTRPTTYRYWKCSFAARYDDLLPEDLQVYDVLPAQAALVQGQPVMINGANQYQVCVATSIVDAASLDAPAGAGSRTIGVRQGRLFVAAKAGTVNGDNLALDLATPAQCAISPFVPGQNVGTALENVGATVAGKCYAAVGVR